MRLLKTFIPALAALAAGVLALPPPAAAATQIAAPLPPALREDERATVALFERASRSVVFITTLGAEGESSALDARGLPVGTGSGFVWDRSGHVVTNYHVIAGAGAAAVTLADVLLLLEERRAGETVVLELLRDGERLTAGIELAGGQGSGSL